MTQATVVEKPKTDAEKLDAGYRYVTIPNKDPYDFEFRGIWLNGTGSTPDFAPGTHLVSPEIADALEDRLAAFERYNTRLMRPSVDQATLGQLARK